MLLQRVTMSDLTKDLKSDIQTGLDRITTLRDEIKLKLHLASMEVKAEWNELEPKLGGVEKAASELSDTAHAAVTDAVSRLSKLRDSLR